MSWKQQLARIHGLFGHTLKEEELAEEIRFHLEMEEQANREAGMPAEEARYAALRKFGSALRVREEAREIWRWVWVETLFADIRYGSRMLLKNPGFTAAAVVTLALGIGANTTIFSAVNGWMLRPPRIKDPGRVVGIQTINPTKVRGWNLNPVSVPEYVAWQEQNRSFEGMAASEWSDFALTGTAEPEQIVGMRVSANYFQVLGVQAALGRTFLPIEDQPGHDQVVILSYGLWKSRFGADPAAVGKVVHLNRESATVIGVMPSDFRLAPYGPQLWTPLVFSPESLRPATHESRSLMVVARLKPGVSVTTAKAEMAALAQSSEQTSPGTSKGWGATARPIQEIVADDTRGGMRPLIGAVILVLLIACVNIASLQLARGTERQKEFAVRAALGASRLRLVRQLLVESLILALAGGGLGLLLGFWGVEAFRNLLNSNEYVRSMAREVTIDHTVLAYTLGISVLSAILFGLAPAIHLASPDLNSALKEGGRTGSASGVRRRARSALVTGEIALALALLIGAGIYVQEFLSHVYAGFGIDPNHVLTANVSLSGTSYKDPSKQKAFFQESLQRLEALPGVVAAGATTNPLPGGAQRVITVSIAGQPPSPRPERPLTNYYAISPDYLRVLRVPLLRGRYFSRSDDPHAPPVVLVNRTFAERYFPGQDAIGRYVRLDTGAVDRLHWSQIVGVVGNVSDWFAEQKNMSQVYEPYLQNPSPAMTLTVRTDFDPAAFAPLLRRTVWSLDKDLPITAVQTMNQVISNYKADFIGATSLMSIFAGLGLALAMVGVFGVTAYTVAQRTHEIAIRMALGAQRGDVLWMVVRKGVTLGAFGIGIGLALAAPLMWLRLPGFADGPTPFGHRAPVYVAAVFLIWLAALLASYIPARRATKVDPMVALRCE